MLGGSGGLKGRPNLEDYQPGSSAIAIHGRKVQQQTGAGPVIGRGGRSRKWRRTISLKPLLAQERAMCQDLNALEASLIKKSKIAKLASSAAAFFLLGGVAFSYCQQAPTLKAMTHNSGLRKLEAPASIHHTSMSPTSVLLTCHFLAFDGLIGACNTRNNWIWAPLF